MKYTIHITLLIVCFSCNKEDNGPVLNKEECQPIEEFHFTCFENEECVSLTSSSYIYTLNGGSRDLLIIPVLRVTNGIQESLFISIDREANLSDTLWFGGSFFGSDPNMSSILYNYWEGPSSVGSFKFQRGPGTKDDFLIIDSFNADTSIIEGRFQCKFPVRQVNDFVNAPDTMRLSCGRFKVKRS